MASGVVIVSLSNEELTLTGTLFGFSSSSKGASGSEEALGSELDNSTGSNEASGSNNR